MTSTDRAGDAEVSARSDGKERSEGKNEPIMAFSRINLPSLYRCVSSYALSVIVGNRAESATCEDRHGWGWATTEQRFPPLRRRSLPRQCFALHQLPPSVHPSAAAAANLEVAPDSSPLAPNSPYFHPRTSPHLEQLMSRTVCSPVVITRSSGSPSVMLTLHQRNTRSQLVAPIPFTGGNEQTYTVEKRYAFPCCPLKCCSAGKGSSAGDERLARERHCPLGDSGGSRFRSTSLALPCSPLTRCTRPTRGQGGDSQRRCGWGSCAAPPLRRVGT